MGNGLSREFARKVGEKGWIGMTWPKQYGGQERSFLERYVVTEEFRAVAAPTQFSSPQTVKAARPSSDTATTR